MAEQSAMSREAHTAGLVVHHNCGGGLNIGVMHPVKGGEVFVPVGRSLAVRDPLVLRGRQPVEEAEALANALLWAAAPALLECQNPDLLEQAADRCRAAGFHETAEDLEALAAKQRAAIHSATGEG